MHSERPPPHCHARPQHPEQLAASTAPGPGSLYSEPASFRTPYFCPRLNICICHSLCLALNPSCSPARGTPRSEPPLRATHLPPRAAAAALQPRLVCLASEHNRPRTALCVCTEALTIPGVNGPVFPAEGEFPCWPLVADHLLALSLSPRPTFLPVPPHCFTVSLNTHVHLSGPLFLPGK